MGWMGGEGSVVCVVGDLGGEGAAADELSTVTRLYRHPYSNLIPVFIGRHMQHHGCQEQREDQQRILDDFNLLPLLSLDDVRVRSTTGRRQTRTQTGDHRTNMGNAQCTTGLGMPSGCLRGA